jgi:hypothetical protein
MGSMSMSDAAPLPRLGEVFFDVRSTSRTLRISWYADTGVAVLSIWQGGTCTGSFRLPMGELPRMIEALQRGPDGRAAAAESYAPDTAAGYAPHAAAGYAPDATGAGPAAAAASHDPYPAVSGSLHYLNGPAAAPYRDETAAGYPDGDAAGYPGSSATAGYQDEPMPSWYADQPGPADYSPRVSHRGFPAGPPGGQYPRPSYPNGAESLGHPPVLAGIERSQSAPGSLYGHGQPGRADEQPAPGWDSTADVSADNGLEPLPESFPYGEPRRSHRR